jgi:hypothetical protein
MADTDAPPDLYSQLGFSREELAAAMRQVWDELIEFVATPGFRTVHSELMSLPRAERPGFVARVLLRPQELAARGVEVPAGILIQTSAFGDRRPTLFVVKKFLPSRFHGAWESVNITFDNEYADDQIRATPRRPGDGRCPLRYRMPRLRAKLTCRSCQTSGPCGASYIWRTVDLGDRS